MTFGCVIHFNYEKTPKKTPVYVLFVILFCGSFMFSTMGEEGLWNAVKISDHVCENKLATCRIGKKRIVNVN